MFHNVFKFKPDLDKSFQVGIRSLNIMFEALSRIHTSQPSYLRVRNIEYR